MAKQIMIISFSVLNTLKHIMAREENWMNRLKDRHTSRQTARKVEGFNGNMKTKRAKKIEIYLNYKNKWT